MTEDAPPPNSKVAKLLVQVTREDQEDRGIGLRLPSGSFDQVAPELAWLSYEREGNLLLLKGTTPMNELGRPEPLFIRHGSRDADVSRYPGPVNVRAAIGSVFIWRGISVYLG